MSNEMIERVAKAIFDARLATTIETARLQAKAAIEAMRYPTTVMIDAGYAAIGTEYGSCVPMAVVHYRIMIDAALKDG